MVRSTGWHYEECLHFPRGAIRFPIELRPPPGFSPEAPSTWPRIPGRLEYVGGRIRYMPPCGDVQQDVCVDLMTALGLWTREHPDFVAGGNEAGMLLREEVRGADGAVWRRADAGARTGGFRRTPPILAAEVAGQDEGEEELREKARWYLGAGVEVVWLLLPETREVVVLTRAGESRHGEADTLPAHASLPGLAPKVAELFAQIARG